jgi:purine-cytosine permease-like protein
VVGFGAMVPFMNTGLLVGPAANALDGADISFVVGFVVAAVLYYPLRRVAAQPAQPAVGAESAASPAGRGPVAAPTPAAS